MKRLVTLLGAGSLLLLLSCRNLVLENRVTCPSLLLFDIENAESFDGVNHVHIAAYSEPEALFLEADTTMVTDIQNQSFYLKVKKSDSVMGYGVMGYEGARKEGSFCWVVNRGENYVPLFRFAYGKVPAREESVLIPVEFVKDFTRVTLRFVNYDVFENAHGHIPFHLCISGNTVGIDAATGIPVKGDFRYEPREEAQGVFHFTVPRQADRSLTLELYGIPELGQEEGLVETFNLWTLFRQQEGFSWEAKNLPDVNLEFEYTQAGFCITVAPWEKGEHLQFDV